MVCTMVVQVVDGDFEKRGDILVRFLMWRKAHVALFSSVFSSWWWPSYLGFLIACRAAIWSRWSQSNSIQLIKSFCLKYTPIQAEFIRLCSGSSCYSTSSEKANGDEEQQLQKATAVEKAMWSMAIVNCISNVATLEEGFLWINER